MWRKQLHTLDHPPLFVIVGPILTRLEAGNAIEQRSRCDRYAGAISEVTAIRTSSLARGERTAARGLSSRPTSRVMPMRTFVLTCAVSRTAVPSHEAPWALGGRLTWKAVRHPFSECFNARLRPRTFPSWWWRRHHRAADSPNAIVDGGSVLLDVIVTSQVEPLAHPLNVSFRKERANVHLKARRFRHCASQVLDYMDVAVSFVIPKLPVF